MNKEEIINNAKKISKRIEKSLLTWTNKQFTEVVPFKDTNMSFYENFKEVVFETTEPNEFYTLWHKFVRSYKFYQKHIFYW